MPSLFVSYVRENKHEVDQLVRQLQIGGYDCWVDSSLLGGQPWWNEILGRIRDCDIFLAVLSDGTARSAACTSERTWAHQLNKPVLPVAVTAISPDTLPQDLLQTHYVDYSTPSAEAAFELNNSLNGLPPAGPLPDPLPPPPPIPKSYLNDLTAQVTQPAQLSQDEQHRILNELEQALRSDDPQEQKSAREILDRFGRRQDLLFNVGQRVIELQQSAQRPTAPIYVPDPTHIPAPQPRRPAPQPRKRSKVVTTLAVLGGLFVALMLWFMAESCSSSSQPPQQQICYDAYGRPFSC